MNLISASFDGNSYGNWKRGVLISLSAKNKLCFINDKAEIPEETSPLFEQWSRCNDMVIAWLLNSLSKDTAESVLYSQRASDLWNELQERYGQPDGSKLFQLQRDLNNISQGISGVAAYYNKLKKLWDQLKVLNTFMNCNCECKCGAKAHNHKMNEDMKLVQFLMGLNEAFSACRGNIFMMKPLPSTSQAYSIILHEESQREVHSSNTMNIDSSAFNVSRWNQQRNQNPRKANTQISNPKNQNNFTPNNNLFCSHCKKINHTIQGC
ncbi:uncharacterized protein LOC132637980 [Lycium barbarum]|uniref:uncharacterized protein LOC132637980 n=1 Tax=Lycium barbarum TaxID=112863 RepID=UPI00293E82E4|nr:uncharacterized protein LOC132637980 [Lycium barbarum]